MSKAKILQDEKNGNIPIEMNRAEIDKESITKTKRKGQILEKCRNGNI